MSFPFLDIFPDVIDLLHKGKTGDSRECALKNVQVVDRLYEQFNNHWKQMAALYADSGESKGLAFGAGL